MYDHFLVNELEPKLAKKVSEYLEIEKKTEAKIMSVLRANNLPVPQTPELDPQEMAQIIRKVAASMKSSDDDSDEENKQGSYTSTLPANVNFVMYDGKGESSNKKREEIGKKELKDQLDKYKTELDELAKRLSQQQAEMRTPIGPPQVYYPQQAYFANANAMPIGLRPQLPPPITAQPHNGAECTRCHNFGHDANSCRLRSNSRIFVHRSSNRNGYGGRHFAPYNTKHCYNCNAPGHFSSDCSLPPRRPCKHCGGNHFDKRCQQTTQPNPQNNASEGNRKTNAEKNVQFTVNIPMDEPEANRITELE